MKMKGKSVFKKHIFHNKEYKYQSTIERCKKTQSGEMQVKLGWQQYMCDHVQMYGLCYLIC